MGTALPVHPQLQRWPKSCHNTREVSKPQERRQVTVLQPLGGVGGWAGSEQIPLGTWLKTQLVTHREEKSLSYYIQPC